MAEPKDRDERIRHLSGGIRNPCPGCGTPMFDRNRDPQEHTPDSPQCDANREWVDKHELEQTSRSTVPPWHEPW